MSTPPKYIDVVSAEHVSDYKVRVTFDDGTRRVVNFGPFLKRARNTMITQYRRSKQFKSFQVKDGDLMWGDFEMIFPIMDLYRGKI